MDYYDTLGIAKNATQDDIKKAYRRMAGIHHPDKGGDTAEFQKIQQAYETLSDPQKKQQYDTPNPFGAGGQHHNMGGFPGGFQFHMNGFNINDIFNGMFTGNPFGQRPHMPSYRTVVHLNLEQVYHGGEQVLQFGAQGGNQIIKIQIPRGVEDGQTMRYDNLIKDSMLLVEFRVLPNPNFERDGPHLYSVQDIDVFDLIAGGEFKFETISGKTLEVKIPAKTQPGHKLRLPREGLPINGEFGDQFILLKPYIPATIDTAITDSILRSKNK